MHKQFGHFIFIDGGGCEDEKHGEVRPVSNVFNKDG